MRSVEIPAKVVNVGVCAFLDCTNLITITVDALNHSYSSMDGVLFNKEQSTLISFPGGKGGSYRIPDGVASISEWAFASYTRLSGVGAMTPPRLAGFALVVGSGLLAWTLRNWKGDSTRRLLLLIVRRNEGESDNAEPSAPPNSRQPVQLPESPEIQPSDSLRTPASGGCG
jgi:hypothetical protein